MPTLNLDTAFVLDVTGIYEGHSFIIAFQRFATNGTTPENWTAGNYSFGISDTEKGTIVREMFTSNPAAGITVVTNLLTVTCLSTQNDLVGGKKYFYNLSRDNSAGIKIVEGKGTMTVNKSVTG